MKLSVILCTYNRCQRLARALQSVAVSDLPPLVTWEVLVVDNNSNDQTREVIEDFCRRHPGRFQYVFEPQQGKSYALNKGIREAHGEVLAFMDDDVTVQPDWLQNLTAVLDNGVWAGSGGRIILEWPSELPNWFSTDGPLARHGFPGFNQGKIAKELKAPPFGTNMAYRKEMFSKHGGFRTDLGPSSTNEIRAEDTEFGRRLIGAGERLCYEPAAVVHHPISKEQINKRRLLRWWFDNGRASARQFPTDPAYLVCSLAAWTFRWMTTFAPRDRFHHKVVVWEKVGMCAEFCRLTFHPKKLTAKVVKETKKECKI